MTSRPTLPEPVQHLHDLVAQRYVLDDDAPAIAERLAGLTAADVDLPPDRLAEVLTATLQEVNGDRHLRVRHRPRGAMTTVDGAWEPRYAANARRDAGGMHRVERLADGIGLLEIHPVMSPIHYAAPYIAGAFALLAGCPALVVDIRRGYGGHPDTVAYLTSFLYGPTPVHLQDMHSRLFPVRQYWTSPVGAAHTLGPDLPVCVLTSGQTFSGCEEFAYNLQALDRATIVGEQTSGGAHPSDVYQLTDVLEAHVPVARSVNAVTGTNWEGVGVTPDIACPAAQALDRALAEFG